MSGISTHVLDVSLGKPAAGVQVTLECCAPNVWPPVWHPVASKSTDEDGRCKGLLAAEKVSEGAYRIVFETGAYFFRSARATLYPEVTVTFTVDVSGASYHIPLLLSPFGYTTYRGS